MATKVFPTVNDVGGGGAGKVITEANLAALIKQLLSQNFVVSGFTVPASDPDLTMSVAPGEANISGYRIVIDVATDVTCQANNINHIFIKLVKDGSGNVTGAAFEVNTTGVAPVDSVKIATAVADADNITGTTDARRLPEVSNAAILGDGSNGDIIISSNTTLTQNMYYNNLTVNAGVILNPGGYRIFVKQTLTNNGTIARNGNNGQDGGYGSGGSGGAALASGYLGLSGYGDDGHTNGGGSGGSVTKAYGGNGGNAGSGAAGAGGSGGTVSGPAEGAFSLRHFPACIEMRVLQSGIVPNCINAGAGGGGGAGDNVIYRGGGGGSGGGPIVICARSLINNGVISANGGNGGNGATGGNTGGGGHIILVYANKNGSGTVTANGGAGGAGSGTGTGGSPGASGLIVEFAL